MKTAIFLFAIVLLTSCSRSITTMQQKIVVTEVKKSKHGVQLKTKRISNPVSVPVNLFKVGDTLTVLTQQKL